MYWSSANESTRSRLMDDIDTLILMDRLNDLSLLLRRYELRTREEMNIIQSSHWLIYSSSLSFWMLELVQYGNTKRKKVGWYMDEVKDWQLQVWICLKMGCSPVRKRFLIRSMVCFRMASLGWLMKNSKLTHWRNLLLK